MIDIIANAKTIHNNAKSRKVLPTFVQVLVFELCKSPCYLTYLHQGLRSFLSEVSNFETA